MPSRCCSSLGSQGSGRCSWRGSSQLPTQRCTTCDIGDFAELGLWLLLGIATEEARVIVGTSPFKAGVDKLFLALLEALPAALAAVDQHGVVERLARLHLLPTCAQCLEHMLREWRKMCLPEGRTARGDPFPGYKELWLAVAPNLARPAAACE